MTFRLPRPTSEPDGREDIARLFRRPMPAPFALKQYATADLPPAANHEGSIVYDSTANTVKVSDGTSWNTYQPTDADLTALAALSTTGLIARNGAGTVATRTLTGPAAGLSVSNGSGAAGDPTIALANDLSALEGLTGTGLARRTGTDTWEALAYEEGTFTPTLLFGGASTGITYSLQTGRHTRIGREVHVSIGLILTNKGSATGNATISGLPFTSLNANPPSIGSMTAASLTTVTVPQCSLSANSAAISLLQFTSGSFANLTNTNFGNTTQIFLSIFYSV